MSRTATEVDFCRSARLKVLDTIKSKGLSISALASLLNQPVSHVRIWLTLATWDVELTFRFIDALHLRVQVLDQFSFARVDVERESTGPGEGPGGQEGVGETAG